MAVIGAHAGSADAAERQVLLRVVLQDVVDGDAAALRAPEDGLLLRRVERPISLGRAAMKASASSRLS